MNFYPDGYTVEVTVPFTDLNGLPVTPTALEAFLSDGEGVVVIDFGSMPFVPGDGLKLISIPGVFNEMSGDALREARVLKVRITTAAGIVTKSLSYILETEQTLEVMVNSFLTFETAEILSKDFVNFSGWTTASDERKRAALVEAYRRICAIPMRYTLRDDAGNVLEATERRILRADWLDIDADYFRQDFPSHFQRALRLAQIIEANEMLSGDSVLRKQRAGVVSETIGESSVTLQASKVDLGLSNATLQALAGYIWFNNRIARA